MIVKDLTGAGFMKYHNEVYRKLSKNGRIVYLAFLYEHPNSQANNKAMAKSCFLGLALYKEGKAELIENGYLLTKRTGGKGSNIIYYFGENAVKKELGR